MIVFLVKLHAEAILSLKEKLVLKMTKNKLLLFLSKEMVASLIVRTEIYF